LRKLYIISFLLPLIFFGQNSEKISDYGFENVQENYDLEQYTLFYEDNLFRFPADGLFEVLNLIEIESNYNQVQIVLLNKGVSIIEMTFSRADFLDFKTQKLDFEDFLTKSKIGFTNAVYDPDKSINPSYFKTDLKLKFRLDYQMIGFDPGWAQVVNFQPMLSSDLGKGFNLQGYYNFPEFNTIDSREPQIELLKVSNDFKITPQSFLNTNFGFYTFNRFGLTFNYIKFLYKDIVRFKLHGGITRFGRLNKDFLLFYQPNIDLRLDYHTDLTFRWNKYDIDMTFRYGSYVLNDLGYTFFIRRYSGQRFISLHYSNTTFGKSLGFNFNIPIPIKKYNRKRPVRLQLYENFYVPYYYRDTSALLNYEGDNIVSQLTSYMPEIVRKGLIKASKKGR
jgi:hypothetical protein